LGSRTGLIRGSQKEKKWEADLEKIRLNVDETGVEDEFQFGLVRHLGHVRRAVHRLGDEKNFLCQQFADFLSIQLPLCLRKLSYHDDHPKPPIFL
jgi:hypothetical protein